jgi:hypothetical protein
MSIVKVVINHQIDWVHSGLSQYDALRLACKAMRVLPYARWERAGYNARKCIRPIEEGLEERLVVVY